MSDDKKQDEEALENDSEITSPDATDSADAEAAEVPKDDAESGAGNGNGGGTADAAEGSSAPEAASANSPQPQAQPQSQSTSPQEAAPARRGFFGLFNRQAQAVSVPETRLETALAELS